MKNSGPPNGGSEFLGNNADCDTKCTPGFRVGCILLCPGCIFQRWGAFSGGGVHSIMKGGLLIIILNRVTIIWRFCVFLWCIVDNPFLGSDFLLQLPIHAHFCISTTLFYYYLAIHHKVSAHRSFRNPIPLPELD